MPLSYELLQSTSTPTFMDICKNAFNLLKENKVSSNLQEVEIGKACILKLETEIRSQQYDSLRNILLNLNKELVSSTLANLFSFPKKIAIPKRKGITNLELEGTQPEMYFGIPSEVGSVLMTIDVFYDSLLTYKVDEIKVFETELNEKDEQSKDKKKQQQFQPPIVKAKAFTRLTFHGCLSGQSDLEWKIVSIGTR